MVQMGHAAYHSRMTSADTNSNEPVKCLDEDTVFDALRGGMDKCALHVHLDQCTTCRRLLASAARNEETHRDGDSNSTPSTVDECAPRAGQLVGERYELLRCVGIGGAGSVWAATDRTDGRDYALKILHVADEELIRRTEREARLLRKGIHPSIVAIRDVVHDERELLHGETLQDALNREPVLAVKDLRRIFVPIASAAHAAHELGVIHRDITPRNIFLAEDRVYLLDFGIAKILPSAGGVTITNFVTQEGTFVGTPRFMAPERIFGEECTAAADVWSIAAILYRAIAGEHPIEATTIGERIKMASKNTIAPITTKRTTISPALATWIMRALSPIPVARPSLSELIRLLG